MDAQLNAASNGLLVSTSSTTAMPTTHYVPPAIDVVPTTTAGPLVIGIAIGLIVIIFMILYCGRLRRRVSYRSQPFSSSSSTTVPLSSQHNMIQQPSISYSQHILQNKAYNNAHPLHFSSYTPSHRHSTWSSTSTLPIQQQSMYHHHQTISDIQINIAPPK